MNTDNDRARPPLVADLRRPGCVIASPSLTRDAALAWLGELLAIRSIYTRAYLRVDPTWAPLRGDRRFEALLAARRPAPTSAR